MSPLEVAEGLAELANDVGYEQALDTLSLETSTARRFLRLRELEPSIAELVDWGRKPGSLSFSVAAEVVRVSERTQSKFAEACLRHAFTKEEARQVVQLLKRRGDSLQSAVDATLRMRPSVLTIHVILGGIHSPDTRSALLTLSQEERDRMLKDAIRSAALPVQPGRLTRSNFSVTSDAPVDDETVKQVERAVNDFVTSHVMKGR